MNTIEQSRKLSNVCYDIRGPVLEHARRLEQDGHRILKLNIGNPAPFGFEAPDAVLRAVSKNLHDAQGYSDSRGLSQAREAILKECKSLGMPGVELDNIYLGNGVSELITLAMQALLNDGDEVLIPAPDYPLWTASVRLSGGKPVHYMCDEQADWFPDLADIAGKITGNTKALVLINPNNPTGAVYSRDLLNGVVELARKHKLILFSDEIYSKIVYDEAQYIPLASVADDVFTVTFNGLSKVYRLAGFRCGWMVLSGSCAGAASYIEGLDILTNMRLCANVPAQFAVQTALGKYPNVNELVLPGARLKMQRDIAWDALLKIPGVSCVKPLGATYLFPRFDPEVFLIEDDERLVLDLLEQKKVLLVQGSAFNMPDYNHLRLVFLPEEDDLQRAIDGLEQVLQGYRR
ncbi:MAG: pyridoxal phosphate-dependent aminotransferase [Pseudohongiellaceae bacterium]